MGFGITSLKKKNIDEIELKKIFVDHLIIGEDFATALAFVKLCKKYGPEKVLWLKSFHESREAFEAKWDHFSFLSIDHTPDQKNEDSCFYKDQQFRLFTGRSQPQSMSKIEEKLLGNKNKKTWPQILEELELQEDWNHYDEWTRSRCLEMELLSFFKNDSQDLVEKDKFCIQSSSHELFISEHIYWGSSFHSLRDIIERDLLDEEIVEAIEVNSAIEYEVPAMVVHLDHQNSIQYPELLNEFAFIPVSQSQEQGHFIGELKESSVTLFHHFQDEGELTKEEVAKRIKKLKRNLERIFKNKEFQKSVETIYFSSHLFTVVNEFKNDEAEEMKNLEIDFNNKLHFLSTYLPSQSFSNNLLLDKIYRLKIL